MLSSQRYSIDDFLAQHNHIRYCEAIVNDDGTVEYAIPSHGEKLISRVCDYRGISRSQLASEMPIFCDMIAYLADIVNTAVVWYSMCYIPKNCSKRCLDSVSMLISSGAMNPLLQLPNNFTGYIQEVI